MADEMLNKSKPYNKSSGLQGIGDTVKLMNEFDMNSLNDTIEEYKDPADVVKKYNKNS